MLTRRFRSFRRASLGWSLSGLIAVQPALAQSIVADDANGRGPDVPTTANGVDMVMIERPNAQGVSRNDYRRFDVRESGVILNNIDGNYGVTNLGGFVQGNPNVTGRAADLIVNQVTQRNPSQLRGYMEVAGQQAAVVLANPYGITCDGCGFINTDRAVLTTGVPRYATGQLDRFEVTEGLIEIGAGGADARGVTQFDLIARRVEFAGAVYGQRVMVIAGQNDVIFSTSQATRRSDGKDTGEAYSIDSSVLGGMYAGKITIRSTEAGAGVRAPRQMQSSAEGMTITSDGRLVVGSASSGGTVRTRSGGDTVVTGQVYAQERVTAEAQRDMVLAADAVIVADAALSLSAGRNMRLDEGAFALSRAEATLDVAQTLRVGQGARALAWSDLGVTAGRAELSPGAMVMAGGAEAGETPATADLTFGISGDATLDSAALFATGRLVFDADAITLDGAGDAPAQLASLGHLAVTGDSLGGQGARLEASGNVSVAIENALRADGVVVAAGRQLGVRADEIALAGALIRAGGAATLAAGGGDLRVAGTVQSAADLALSAAGSVVVAGQVMAQGDLDVRAGAAVSQGGEIIALGVVGIDAAAAMTLDGRVEAAGAMTLGGQRVDVTGGVATLKRLDLVATDLDVRGEITAAEGMALVVANAVEVTGDLRSGAAATIDAGGDLRVTGGLLSGGTLTLASGAALDLDATGLGGEGADLAGLAMSGERLGYGGDLVVLGPVSADGTTNLDFGGTLTTAGDVMLRAGADATLSGALTTGGVLGVTAGGALSLADTADLAAVGDLSMAAASAVLAGRAASAAGLEIAIAGEMETAAALLAGGDIALAAGTLVQTGTLASNGALRVEAGGRIDNRGAVQAAGSLELAADGALTNTAPLIGVEGMTLSAGTDLANEGSLASNGAIGIEAGGTLTNRAGAGTPGAAMARSLTLRAAQVINTADLTATDALTLDGAARLENTGALLSGGTLRLAGGALDNGAALDAVGDLALVAGAGGLTNSGPLRTTGALRLDAEGALVTDADLTGVAGLSLAAAGDLTVTGGLLTGGLASFTAGGTVLQRADGLATDGASARALSLTGARVVQAGDLVVQDAVTLTATDGDAVQRGALTAGGDVTATASGAVLLSGMLATAADLTAVGASLRHDGDYQVAGAAILRALTGGLEQSGDLLANGRVTLDAAGSLTQTGTLVSAGESIAATMGSGALGGEISAARNLTLSATGALSTAGQLQTGDALVLTGDRLTLGGTLRGLGGVLVTGGADASTDVTGAIESNGDITLEGARRLVLADTARLLSTAGRITLDSTRAMSLGGEIRAGTDVSAVTARSLVVPGLIEAAGTISLTSRELDTDVDGSLAAGRVDLAAGRDIGVAGIIDAVTSIEAAGVARIGGEITGAGLLVTADRVDNQGRLLTDGDQVFTTAGDLLNSGTLEASGRIGMQAGGLLSNSGGIDAGSAFVAVADRVTNGVTGRIEGATVGITTTGALINEGRILSNGAAAFSVGETLTNRGRLEAQGQFDIAAQSLTNRGAIHAFGGALLIEGLDALDNTGGTLSSDTGVRLRVATLDPGTMGQVLSDDWLRLEGRTGGAMAALTIGAGQELVARGDLVIRTTRLVNDGTLASANGSLLVRSRNALVNRGLIFAGDTMVLRAGGTVRNDAATILAVNDLVICGNTGPNCLDGAVPDRAAQVINQNGAVVESLNGAVVIAADTILNERDGEAVVSTERLNDSYRTYGRDTCRTFLCAGNDSHWYYKLRSYEDHTTVTLDGAPSMILSGGDIVLNAGDITNSYSMISAVGSISVDAGTLTNLGAQEGILTFSQRENWYYDDGWFGDNKDQLRNVEPATTSFTVTGAEFGTIEAGGSITGTVTGFLTNGARTANDTDLFDSGSGPQAVTDTRQTAGRSALSGFEAGSGLTTAPLTGIDGRNLTGATVVAANAGLDFTDGALPLTFGELTLAPRGISLPGEPNVASQTGASLGSLVEVTMPGGSGTAMNGLDPAAVVGDLQLQPLSNDQLFVVASNSGGSYLIETRPDFIDPAAFVSSDYFLATLGLDPDLVMMRIGDGMAETYLIRSQIFSLIGRRIIAPGMSERDQMRRLYDNAVGEAERLGLRYGVALSPQQIAALTDDIIWLEERVVNGRTVLVPQVYLAASGGFGGPFAQITAGEDIVLNVGALNNIGGQIAAGGALGILSLDDILNDAGTLLAGGNLTLQAGGDVLNLSGVIAGQDVTISAENIVSETRIVQMGDMAVTADIAGLTALISADGALALNAVGDISVIGGRLAAVDGATIIAGGDIDFAALGLERSMDLAGDGFSFTLEERLNRASEIAVTDGDLTVASLRTDEAGNLIGGGSVLFEGTQIAASGDVDISAFAGDVIIGAATDVTYSDSFAAGGGLLGSSLRREERLDVVNRTTAMTGQSIDVLAGGGILDQSTGYTTTGGDLTFASGTGDVLFQSVTDIEARNIVEATTILGGLMDFSTETQSLRALAQSTQAAAAGDVGFASGGDLEFQGGRFVAEGAITTDVAGDTRVLATVDTDFRYVQDHSNNSLLVVDTTAVDLAQVEAFTWLEAGEGIAFDPDSPVTLGLVGEQAAIGPNVMALVGVDNGADPAQTMALTPYFLPDATAPPQTRIGELTRSELTLALAGAASGDGSAGDGADDGRFDFAGSRVDVGIPGAGEGAGYGYLDALTRRDDITIEEMALIQHHFEDEQVQLGVVGQLALTYLTGQIMGPLAFADTALGMAGQAATRAAISGVIEGAVTGNLDIDSLLTDVAFAGVSGFATASFDLADALGIDGVAGNNTSLLGADANQFTVNGIVSQLGDSAISAGLTTAIHGTAFGDAFAASFRSGVVTLATADIQNLIGDEYAGGANGGEGSAGHVFSHALAGCGSAALAGGDCAAGAAAAAVAAVGSGLVRGSGTTPEEAALWTDEIAFVAGLGAALTGADTADVLAASGIGTSAFVNNYLSHAQLDALQTALAQCGDDRDCLRSVHAQFVEISAAQQHELAMCGNDLSCLAPHLQAMHGAQSHPLWARIIAAAQTPRADAIAALEEQAHAVYMGLDIGGEENWFLSTFGPPNPNYAGTYAGYPDWAAQNCGGRTGAECMAGFQGQVRQGLILQGAAAGAESFATSATIGFGGGLTVAVAPGALTAVRACAVSPACWAEMTAAGGELALGLSGATAGQTFFTVATTGAVAGQVVMRHGDEILGVLDDAGRIFRPVSQGLDDQGRFLVQAADGSVGYLDDGGRFVPTRATTGGVVEGEVGLFGDLAPRSVRDGMTPDHIPSFAAVKESLRRSGVDVDSLSDADLRALRANTNCVVVQTCDHLAFSRTFGGRNSSAQIQLDGQDLRRAADADLDTWEPVWRSSGWTDADIAATRAAVHDYNQRTFAEMGLTYGSD